jgi:hypothetical protein
MRKLIQIAMVLTVASLGTAAASANAAPAKSANTQDLSARCRTVVTHRWRHGQRVTVRRRTCGIGRGHWRARDRFCKVTISHRWRHGHRVTIRRRVCH